MSAPVIAKLRVALWLNILPMAALLAACSGEPGTADMKDAIDRTTARDWLRTPLGFALQFRSLNPSQKPEGTVEKIGCVQAQGQPGFVCDFRWRGVNMQGMPDDGRLYQGRFFKAGDGWAVESRTHN